MAPKAIIESVDQIGSELGIRGVFTDEISFKAPFAIRASVQGDESAKNLLRNEYNIAIAQATLKSSIKPGVVVDLTAPVIKLPEPPTTEQQAINDYLVSVQRVLRAKQFVDLGIIDSTDADYRNLLITTQKLRPAGYIG